VSFSNFLFFSHFRKKFNETLRDIW
jgi:hypothetical protein